ncbi:MAG: zinc ribbon domain-containing protein [Acidobacteria bacterium]|nr:MAG: zinc ribbon domain-containing protein [Acidobacteriota bacterium]
MALYECRECGGQVSDQAVTCPHCGAPYPARLVWKGWGVDKEFGPRIFGYPLVHIAFGRDTGGRLRVAKGVIAIGQFAVGGITIAQFGIGVLGGLGQMMIAPLALGQLALGYIAVGQIVVCYMGLAQVGLAPYIWSMQRADPEAVEFFKEIFDSILQLIGKKSGG